MIAFYSEHCILSGLLDLIQIIAYHVQIIAYCFDCCILSTLLHLMWIITSYPDRCILPGSLHCIQIAASYPDCWILSQSLHPIYIVTYWDSCILLKSCFVIVKTTSHPRWGFFREVLLFLQSNAPVRSRYHKTLSLLQIKKKSISHVAKEVYKKCHIANSAVLIAQCL